MRDSVLDGVGFSLCLSKARREDFNMFTSSMTAASANAWCVVWLLSGVTGVVHGEGT